MDKKIKKLWLAALRSGEYRQARYKLRTRQNGFCCLGVLCNIHAQENPELAALNVSPLSYFGETGLLPSKVKSWAGLKSNNPTVKYKGNTVTLALLNDNKRLTYNQIADLIEEQL